MTDSFMLRVPSLKKELIYQRLQYNHEIFDWFVDQMPIQTFIYHTIVSGWMISLLFETKTPTTWKPGTEVVENLVEMPEGRVIMFMPSGRSGTWMNKYGKITESMWYPSVCQLRKEDLPELVSLGNAVWKSLVWSKDIIKAELVRCN